MTSVWEALAGRAPGQPIGPADPGLWAAVVDRLNPARGKPILRAGIEEARLTSVRGEPYVMLKSSGKPACYLRLSPQEWQLARSMDGAKTVARLVAEFAQISGQLAPDRVIRLVANLAANRMLEELPLDAFRPLRRIRKRPLPVRIGHGLLAAARGQRLVLANVDPLIGFIYRAGGRLLFTKVAAVLLALVALAGLVLFGIVWAGGSQSIFLTDGSYATGAAILLAMNVIALACHELGHGLAAKHAGRRVPAAGFLVYFGIPSVFVDTTDVWMAGRKARLLTTAAGPAAGLILAGAAQIVGLLVPELAPWTFKLSFAWYLNVLLNLNPFLALDGYYLLMDWLELPNLRARGIAWLATRIRRRPPRWSQLDREGRMIALYGALAGVWLIIAINIAYRIYADRVSGVVTGLWESGWPARLLLVAIIAGLGAPLVHALLGWIGRRLRDASRARTIPRRAEALRGTAFGALPAGELDALARQAQWLRPRTGEWLDLAGRVLVVVDGAVEGRRPGDLPGTVRQRITAGGLVRDRGLIWHTAGTTLMSLPAAATGALGAEHSELAELVPGLPAELVSLSQAVDHPTGTTVTPPSDAALVLAAGVIVLADSTELRPGALVNTSGTARSAVRLWRVPITSGVPVEALVLGSPKAGVHPMAEYPPLFAPPSSVPPSSGDDPTDARFERRLRRMLAALLLLALALTGSHFVAGPVWSEMPSDRALLKVTDGTITANGRQLDRGDRTYVGTGDPITVDERSRGTLTFRGGASMVLCAESALTVGPLWTVDNMPVAQLELTAGRVLASTASESREFAPVALTVLSRRATVGNHGAARFSVAFGVASVTDGVVLLNGLEQATSEKPQSCGAGSAPPNASPSASAFPSPSPSPSPTASPSPSPSPSPVESVSPSATTKKPPTPPVVDLPPTISWVRQPEPMIDQQVSGGIGCNSGATVRGLIVSVADDHDSVAALVVKVYWEGSGYAGSNTITAGTGNVGPIAYAPATWEGGQIAIRVTVTDTKGHTTQLNGNAVTVSPCHI